MDKKTIFFVISHLGAGGAEKVLIDLLISLKDKEIYDISLIIFEKKGVLLKQVPDNVKIICLNKKSKFSFFKMIFDFSKIIRKYTPDTIISFMEYENLVSSISVLLSKKKTNLILTIHNFLSLELKHQPFLILRKFLYCYFFSFSNQMIVPSFGVKNDLIENFNKNWKNIKVIKHPLRLDKIKSLKENTDDLLEYKYILSVGRLVKQKGYTYLIDAYASIHDQIEEKLVIIGVGDEDLILKEKVNKLNLSHKVIFLGYTDNPYKYMKNASIFALTSIFESFGIVLIEAFACNVPVISSNCKSGPGEIIDNNKNGLLVDPKNINDLKITMLKLIKDKDLRLKLTKNAKQRVKQYKIENIVPLYEELF